MRPQITQFNQLSGLPIAIPANEHKPPKAAAEAGRVAPGGPAWGETGKLRGKRLGCEPSLAKFKPNDVLFSSELIYVRVLNKLFAF